MSHQRKEDGPGSRKHFSTDRVVQDDGLWYFYTREGTTEGPYHSRLEAVRTLESFILHLDLDPSPAYFELALEA